MKVAFDFDNTLTTGEGDELIGFNPVMIRRAHQHAKAGDELWIVTARPRAARAVDRAFSRRKGVNPRHYVHALVRYWGLPIPDERILFVGGTGKGPFLARRGIELLYDDRSSQRRSAQAAGVRAEAPDYPRKHRGQQRDLFPEYLVTPKQISDRWGDIFEELELDWSDDNDAETAAEVLARETGLPRAGVGNTRAVFALDPYTVIKLAFWHGDEDNLGETIVWERADEGDRRWLAPVFDADPGGAWLTMGRAGPVPEHVGKQIRKGKFDHIARHLGIDDLRSASNWGIYKGKLAIIDYGHLLDG